MPGVRKIVATIAASAAAVFAGGSSVVAAPRAIATIAQEMTPTVARCLIRREPETVRAWLQTLPGTPEEKELVRRAEPRFTACFDPFAHAAASWAATYDASGMRASLVRAILQSRRSSLPQELVQPEVAPTWYVTPPNPSRDAVIAIVAADLGTCLAKKRWADVVALISSVDPGLEKLDFVFTPRSEAAQRRETAKVMEVLPRFVPYISSCVPAGLTLRLDNRKLRAIVEEAAVHLTKE